MDRPYHTLLRRGSDEFTVNKSRFIGYAAPVETEAEALAFLEEIRGRHRDARHCCYAYIIGRNAGIMRYSDDGEPGGTAGLPMISLLKARELVNCCVGVVRYFGGILLGTGGLVRAYTQGCDIAVKAAGQCLMEPSALLLCEIAYDQWDLVQYQLKSLPALVVSTEYTASVSFELQVRVRDLAEVQERLTRATNGRLESLLEETRYAAWPEDAPLY